MVLKPAPQDTLVPRPLSQAAHSPPYPTTPTTEEPPIISHASPHQEVYSPDLATSPAFNLRPLGEAQKKKGEEDSDSDYSEDWDRSDDEDNSPAGIPDPLKIGGGKPLPTSAGANKNEIPDVLKAGPPPGMPIKKPANAITPDLTGASAASWGAVSNSSAGSIPLHSNNPYLRMQPTGQSLFGGESSHSVWGNAPSQASTYGQLAELPSVQTPDSPTNPMASLNLNSDAPPQQVASSPNQPPLIAVESPTPHQTLHATSPRHDSNAPETFNPQADICSMDAWASNHGLDADNNQPENISQTWEEQQEWEWREREQERVGAAAQQATTNREQETLPAEDFHKSEQPAQYTPDTTPEKELPALPPRRSQEQEQQPAMPPKPIDTAISGPSQTSLESPNTVMQKQRKENYQIKHIRWLDANTRETRTSPILTQNINGPCPLLALVNALVLSTPAGTQTDFVETLHTREQISLGFLLDAVFEELMSGRRGEAAQELPDVNELYKFLLGLQTGLNVNPMLVKDSEATDGPSTLTDSFANQPGGFENTKEMRLYRTFNVPLWHGWLPEPGSDAYIAFERVAKSYETSQLVQFQEEELLAKLQDDEGLNEDEQRLFTDIQAIKEFLSQWPTQLTDYGIRTMRDSMKPGQVAILFRNDHFSTLYKNPHTNELMTLVTDQGYSTHDEIVWESLTDVNGQGSELYSGDFRAVGNNTVPQRQEQQQSMPNLIDMDDNEGWTTVSGRHRDNNRTSSTDTPTRNAQVSPPMTGQKSTEQEDHDLALALQLQEEEDDRHRRETGERRRRENQLSEDAIAAHSQARPGNRRTSRQSENPPLIPPRRNNVPTHRPTNEPAPPPTYEEAATSPQYHPPQGHPASPNALLRPQGPQASASAYQGNISGLPPGQGGRRSSGRPMGSFSQTVPGRPGRRHSQSAVGPGGEQDKDKCVVM